MEAGRIETVPEWPDPAGGAAADPASDSPAVREPAWKRPLDLTGAALALALCAPLMVALALAVRLADGGPVLFRQRRVGRGGRPFTILKVRTMQAAGDPAAAPHVAPGDPRVTRIGRWLRRSGLDELPQLVNVLRGEMALVGPRPHALDHDALYARLLPGYAARRAVRPGMTGWAQVHGLRGPAPSLRRMAERAAFDRAYLARRSLWLDLRILLATPGCLWHPDAA